MTSSRVKGVVTRYFRRFDFDSIRNKILLFAVLATLLPSGITAWVSYSQSRNQLEARIDRELVSLSQQSAREISVWISERLQEMRTVSASGEVLPALAGGGAARRERPLEYLRAVRGRLQEYAELIVINNDGQPVLTTAGEIRPILLPPGWLGRLRRDNDIVGALTQDLLTREVRLTLAVPIMNSTRDILGALAARVQLAGVREELARMAGGTGATVYLTADDGSVIMASGEGADGILATPVLREAAAARLAGGNDRTVTYTNPAGVPVIGVRAPVPQIPWGIVAEMPASSAFREMLRFRNVALAIVAGLLLVASVLAYWLGRVIVRPLDRLTQGAAEVAAGDLAVDLPAGGGGEVGYLTHVFNHMVSRLRESRKELDTRNATLKKKNEELERLSTTDALTALFNRRHLGQRLTEEVTRSRRHKHALSVLMLDVDHFKKYNDQHGHPAGDTVLKRCAQILRESTREVDCVARYGGEEFCVLLPETGAEAAVQVAERIRTKIGAEQFTGGRITVSIGIAEYGKNGEAPEVVVAAADAALYQAKRAGRDRVVRSR